MNKKKELVKRLCELNIEVEKAKLLVDDEKKQYLCNYAKNLHNILERLEKNSLPASKGGVIGTLRGISEYDNLASIVALYNAAYEVDAFYSEMCRE